MALADPVAITVGGVALSLPKTGTLEHGATYTKDDNTVLVRVNHIPAKNSLGTTKRTLELDVVKTAADPLNASVNVQKTFKFFLNAVEPAVGFTIADKKDIAQALMTWVNASSGANLTKWLGGES
jgi:hypothetical protein